MDARRANYVLKVVCTADNIAKLKGMRRCEHSQRRIVEERQEGMQWCQKNVGGLTVVKHITNPTWPPSFPLLLHLPSSLFLSSSSPILLFTTSSFKRHLSSPSYLLPPQTTPPCQSAQYATLPPSPAHPDRLRVRLNRHCQALVVGRRPSPPLEARQDPPASL